MSQRAVLVEDDHEIAKDVSALIAGHPNFNLLATASNVTEAFELIATVKPELVITDICLGHQTAFDLLEQLSPMSFRVVFLTSFPQYAIKALKLGALDYLLKPVDELELAHALDRAYQRPAAPAQELLLEHQPLLSPTLTGRIAVRSHSAVKVIALEDITYITTADQTNIFLTDGRVVTTNKPLVDLEAMLPPALFIRTHQSYLVNVRYVDTFYPEGQLALKNGQLLPVAERRRSKVLSFLTGM